MDMATIRDLTTYEFCSPSPLKMRGGYTNPVFDSTVEGTHSAAHITHAHIAMKS